MNILYIRICILYIPFAPWEMPLLVAFSVFGSQVSRIEVAYRNPRIFKRVLIINMSKKTYLFSHIEENYKVDGTLSSQLHWLVGRFWIS